MFGCLLGETKIIIHASRPAFLTPVALALVSLMYPLQWSSVFIPYLPSAFHINDFAQAPVPFVVGVTSGNFASLTHFQEIVEVNLNANTVIIPKHLKPSVRLPKSLFRKATSKLSSLAQVRGKAQVHCICHVTVVLSSPSPVPCCRHPHPSHAIPIYMLHRSISNPGLYSKVSDWLIRAMMTALGPRGWMLRLFNMSSLACSRQ